MHASTDDNPEKRVLQPIQPLNSTRKRVDFEEDPYGLLDAEEGKTEVGDDFEEENECWESGDMENTMERRLDELDDDCYFPKDGYDYSQHLKKINEKAVIRVEPIEEAEPPPLSKEEIEAMEALDASSDAGYDELDDDFFVSLNPKKDDALLWGDREAEHIQLHRSHQEALEMFDDDDEFCIASVNAADPRFERIMEAYGDEDIGDLEDEEVRGELALDDIEDVLDDYLDGKVEEAEENLQQLFGKNEEIVDRLSPEENMRFLDLLDELPNLSDEEEVDPVERWDCETILSTRSNISNHPGKIELEKRPRRRLQPVHEIEEEEEVEEILELPEVSLFRPKEETCEEKRARKLAVKERQRLCRQMKKEKTLLYRTEDLKLREREVGRGDIRFKARVVAV